MNRVFVLIVLLISCAAYAQQADSLHFGTPFKIDGRASFEGILGERDTLLFGIEVEYQNRNPNKIFLTHLNTAYTPTKRVMLNDRKEDTIDGRIIPEKVIILQKRILYFETLDITDENTRYLKVRILNLEGRLEKSEIIDTISNYKTNEDVFYIYESTDEKRFCIAKTLPYESNENQIIVVRTFSENGNQIWQDEVELPYDQKNYSFTDLQYDGHNKLYLLSKKSSIQGQGFSRTQYLITNAYNIWAYDYEKRKVKEFEINIKNKWINDLKVVFGTDKMLHVAGYYSNDRTFSVGGVFHIAIDSTFTIRKQKLNSITKGVRIPQDELGDNQELQDIYLRNVLVNEFGEVFIIGESYYKEVNEYYDPRSNITTYSDSYYYGTIWVTKYNPLGEVVYTSRVPKSQISINDDGIFLSFVATMINNNVFIFYNDHEKNADLSYQKENDFKDFQNMRRAAITCAKLTESGAVEKVFAQEIPNNFIMIPQNSEPFENKVYFVAEKGREVQVLKFQP